jgi:hypothetical protein
MWLSKPIYEFLPYYYIGAGLFALGASFYVNYWYWPTICLVTGMLCLTGGLVVLLKRKDHRRELRRQ